MVNVLASLKIGYVPYASSFKPPGDRRRFVRYAQQRSLSFEVADPGKKYDVVVLSERADLSVWHSYSQGKIVYDLIDSYLAIPRRNLKSLLRGMAKFATGQSRYLQLDYRRSVEAMCKRADAVVCTTEEQRQDISQYCDNVHLILDSHGTIVQKVKISYEAATPFRLVWEGLPQNLPSLVALGKVLRSVARQVPIELHVVTDACFYRYLGYFGSTRTLDVIRDFFEPVIVHDWSEENLAAIATHCDLAVIPLTPADPFATGKPENKLLLFWRLGVPVLTTATPAYRRAMQGAGLDMICSSEADWEKYILRCIAETDLRRKAGEAGRRFTESVHPESRLLQSWDAVFESVL